MSESSHPAARRMRAIAMAAVFAACVAGVWHFAFRHSRKVNLELAEPRAAIAALAAKSLYYNAAARPWLLARRADLLTAEDRDEHSERSRGFAQAVENPKLFRQLDRRHRFDTLLLVGDPSQYRPMLDHLSEAKDWTLVWLDHASMVFKREPEREWRRDDLDAIERGFSAKEDRALFLAQSAVKLLAIRRSEDAKACLDKAASLDDRVPDVWNGMAIYRMARGEWTPARTAVDRALALDADFLPAIATKTQILFSTKKFNEAYALSGRLIAAYPDDPALLFYHAKICHQAHAYADEIRALTRLIERADAEARTATGYRLYLAQAYAADGQAQPSIDEFSRVLADQEISPEQRKFAGETLAQIKSRSGL